MAEPVLIPNSSFLGRGYDVVEMDPLNLGETSKSENLIALDVSEGPTRTSPDGSFTIPAGVHHVAIFSMSWETQSSVISSGGEFQREFKRSVEADAGVEGLFEFSGSNSRREVARQAESRKDSFVYSRAFQQNHRLSLDLDNPKAPLGVTSEFAEAVADLPPPDAEDWVERYEDLVNRFGTHFTKEIVLGGLAYQRTSGSSKTFLKSSETEETLKTHAGVQIKALKAGAGYEESTSLAAKTDAEHHLERTALEFRGGDGSPSGIDDSWIRSLHERPAIVKAKLDRISTLLTERFFPDDEFIHDKRLLLDKVISSWIASKGSPGCGTAPLRHGEPLVLILPWNDQKTLQTPTFSGGVLQYPVRQGEPVRDSDESVAVALESVDGRKSGAAVLAGDVVRIKHLGRNAYLSERPGGILLFEGDANKAVGLTVLHHGDNPFSPSRIGEFLLETDPIVLLTGRPGAPGSEVGIAAGPRSLVHSARPYQAGGSLVGFHLKRCQPPGRDDEGAPEPLVTA
ncbi:MAG: MAC/perforin domain-containing protein [Isosphaeraceae bacterium]